MSVEPVLAPQKTMLERVADAIDQGVCRECRRPCVGGITPRDCEKSDCAWDRATQEQQARAAIEAMREPTEAMEQAGFGAGWWGDRSPLAVWNDMIDAALADPPA